MCVYIKKRGSIEMIIREREYENDHKRGSVGAVFVRERDRMGETI